MIDPRPYDIGVTSILGPVDVSGVIEFVDREPTETWERATLAAERGAHTRLLLSIGAPLHSVAVQRVQSEGTLAALYGAVV